MKNEIQTFSVRSLTKMAICVALLCVSAYISFPLPFASAMITALTIVMNLAAFVLTPQQTLIVMVVYLLMGAAGLPVFVGGAAGFGEIMGPRGGFLLAFVIAYPIVSALKGTAYSFRRYFLIAVLVGIPLTYIGGLLSLMYFMHLELWAAMLAAVFPFIPGDILKAAAAAYLGVKLNRIFSQED